MATWTSSMDVLEDLDKLSEFSAGCDSVKDIPIVSYSAYGRGSPVGDKEAVRPPSPEFNMVEEGFQLPQMFQPGAGRGERILALSRNRPDLSLQQQLRMAMGPGYSNELIEDYILNESSGDNLSKAEQFDDAEPYISSCEAMPGHSCQEGISSYKAVPDCSNDTKEPTSYPSSVTAEAVIVTDTDTVTCTKDVKPKTSVRRNRNALLSSLPNFSSGTTAVEAVRQCEMKTHMPVQVQNSSYDCSLNCTDTISDHFKNEIKVPLPNQIGRISADDSRITIKMTDSGFQFRDEDFPPL